MLQRRIVFGRRSPPDSNTSRSRNKNRVILLSTDAMTLIGEDVASGWRPLVWFWCSIAGAAVVVGAVLTTLGPPAESAIREPAAAGLRTEGAAPAASRPVMQRIAGAPVLSAATDPGLPAPRSPQPDQAPAAPASDGAGPADTPPRSRVLIVLHPARAESGAALADRLAARAGVPADQVDVGTVAEARSEAAVRFYSEADHALARRLGRELAGMGYSWKLQNYSQRPGAAGDRALDVWLPAR